jgi:hypothetical protein
MKPANSSFGVSKFVLLNAIIMLFVILTSCATKDPAFGSRDLYTYYVKHKNFYYSVHDAMTLNYDRNHGYTYIGTYGCDIAGYSGEDKDVIIPQKIGKRLVIYIGNKAFKPNNKIDGLTSVIIPETVVYIGSDAFNGNQLTSVIIPNSVIRIGNGAFKDNQLISITIPDSVKLMEGSAFANNQLTSVTIPNSITTIENGAFANNQLTSVTIPSSVTTIGDNAFANNPLTSVTIPNSVTSIGENAFANNQLTSVTIPNSVTTIESGAFANNQLTSVTILSSVTTIGNDAFANNPLTSVTTIGDNAFDGIRPYIYAYGAGTYTIENNRILRNGQVIRDPATLITNSKGYNNRGPLYFISIDGKRPSRLDSTDEWKMVIDRDTYNKIPEKLRNAILYYGVTYIPPGMHSVEVTFIDTTGYLIGNTFHTNTIWSEDSLIWEHRYLFEGGIYVFTAKPEGDKIVYRIEPQ